MNFSTSMSLQSSFDFVFDRWNRNFHQFFINNDFSIRDRSSTIACLTTAIDIQQQQFRLYSSSFSSNVFDLISISTSSAFRFFHLSVISKPILTINRVFFARAFFVCVLLCEILQSHCVINFFVNSNFRCFSLLCCISFHFSFNFFNTLFVFFNNLLFFSVIRTNYRESDFKHFFLRV